MLGYVLLGALAAFGLFSIIWGIVGSFLSCWRGCILVYFSRSGKAPGTPILCYRWLQGLGLIKSPLLIVGSNISPQVRQRLQRRHSNIEFCSPEELPSRLELERKSLD